MKFEWQKIESHEENRVKVFGGWSVRTVWYVDSGSQDGVAVSSSLVFIPDKNHEWVCD